jgi:hypothetical protein
MNTRKLAAMMLITAGALRLAYGGFQLGPVHLPLNEKQYVDILVWAGIAAVAIGGLPAPERQIGLANLRAIPLPGAIVPRVATRL